VLSDRKQQVVNDPLTARLQRFWCRLRDDTGAVAIEYVIVAIALLAIAGAIAGALTTLGNDAVEQLPDSISGLGSTG
jgi:Flp pilus assembly pilin Flp